MCLYPPLLSIKVTNDFSKRRLNDVAGSLTLARCAAGATVAASVQVALQGESKKKNKKPKKKKVMGHCHQTKSSRLRKTEWSRSWMLCGLGLGEAPGL